MSAVSASHVRVNPDALTYSLTPEGARALLRVMVSLGLLPAAPTGGAQ